MAKVLGFGGVFMKSPDPKALSAWYRDVLGVDIASWGGGTFEETGAHTAAWMPFAADTAHFAPSGREFMINLRVDDLDGMLARLREKGANVLDRGEKGELGGFGYVVDPDGTLLELWEPAPEPAATT